MTRTPIDSLNRHAWTRLLWAIAAAVCLSNPGVAQDTGKRSDGTLAGVLETGVLRVGMSLYPPWAVLDKEGELRGFEVDVARKLALELGVGLDITILDWEDLVPSIVAGDVDLVASGLSVTAQRALQVNFSQPYSTAGIGLATNTARTGSFDSLTNLNHPDIVIGAVSGTVSERLAKLTFPNSRLTAFKTSSEAGKALVTGKLHAFVASNPLPRFLALQNPGKVDEPLSAPLLPTRQGFAIAKGDADFLAYLNAWIVEHESDTWLAAHFDYWFNTLDWQQFLAGDE